MKKHLYSVQTTWDDHGVGGTKDYKSYTRNHKVRVMGKPELLLSSDPSFMGDKSRHNPEELFLTSLSSCHMLWYLHLCSSHNITVIRYVDNAEGVMIEAKDGRGKFETVLLKPVVTVLEAEKLNLAVELHAKANDFCFIANSCNFKIDHDPTIKLFEPYDLR